MIFEQRKLNTETLSEYLVEVRENLGMSVEDVAAKTGIKPAFLEHLEEGSFLKLPPDVYVKGFLKQLSALYNVDQDILVKQFKKEREIQQQLAKPKDLSKDWPGKMFGKIVVTPKSVSVAAGVLFVAITLGYIVWQVASINQTPSLEIMEPKDRQVIKDSVVNVAGKTDPGMIVTVNGQNVFVDEHGNFKTQLGIAAGQKSLEIESKNKFDKTVKKTVSVVAEEQATQPEGQVQLKLEFSDTVTLQIAVDESQAQTATFHRGEVKLFSGQKRITISTSDAGATTATLNGQTLGPLGRPKETLKAVSFFPESGNSSENN